jgi:hypothetical protein
MRVTAVSKCLDRKLILFGYEVFDLLAIFMALSILNLVFGQTPLKWLFVWLPTLALALLLRYGKRGKPEKYMIHWVRFQIRPGVYSAFLEAPHAVEPPQLEEKD